MLLFVCCGVESTLELLGAELACAQPGKNLPLHGCHRFLGCQDLEQPLWAVSLPSSCPKNLLSIPLLLPQLHMLPGHGLEKRIVQNSPTFGFLKIMVSKCCSSFLGWLHIPAHPHTPLPSRTFSEARESLLGTLNRAGNS